MTESSSVRLKPLKGEASRILKLCLEKDRKTALQGLELAAAIGAPLEGLLEGVSIDADGKIVRSKRFNGNDKTQPVLDSLLLLQLSLAAKGSEEAKLRTSITHLVCKVCRLTDLSGFTKLVKAELTLDAEFSGTDLSPIGQIKSLKSLAIGGGLVMYGQAKSSLPSLKGMDAPALEELDVPFMQVTDVSALGSCEKLRRVNLRGNSNLKSISGLQASSHTLEWLDLGYCSAIETLKPIRGASKLRFLDMGGLERITELSDLSGLKKLEAIDFSGCESLTSLEGLPLKTMRDSLMDPDETPTSYLALNDLKSLRTLKGLPPIAAHITEVMINRAPQLAHLDDLCSASDSLEELRINQVGVSDLSAFSNHPKLHSVEVEKCAELVDASALANLEHLQVVQLTGCPKLETLPQAWKSSVKILRLSGCGALKPIKALPPGIDAKTIEIDDRKLLPRAKPTKAMKSDVGAVYKLLSSRDVPNILMGLELSTALGPDFDGLLEGVGVKNGQLQRGKRFTGTGPAQPFLDLALFGLLSRAPSDSEWSKMRGKITQLELVFCAHPPQLDGLTHLEQLFIRIGEETTPDLSGFGAMPKLNLLKINGSRWNAKGKLVSLKGLEAPALKECDLSCSGVEDLSALSHSPLIRLLDLSGNSNLSDLRPLKSCASHLQDLNLSECKKLVDLDVLEGASNLTTLNLRECESLTSVVALSGCTKLESIDLDLCAKLQSLQGLAQLPIKATQNYQGTSHFSLDGCHALTSLAHLPEFEGKLSSLSINHARSLRDFSGLRQISTLTHLDARHSGLSDLSNITALPQLTHLDLTECDSLHDATALGKLKHLEAVDFSESAVTNLPMGWDGPVTSLTLKNCHKLKTLAQLPAALVKLTCDGSNLLTQLDGMQDCSRLESISVESCASLTDLGTPPASLLTLHARGSSKLTTLNGLEACTQLQTLGIPLSVADTSSLKSRPKLTVCLDFHELGKPAKKGDLLSPDPSLIEAINALPDLMLELKGPSGSWYNDRSIDLNALSKFKTAVGLNFSEFDFHCKVEELTWLLDFPHLKSLTFYPRGNMSHILDGGVFDSPKKVKTLQLRICKEAGIKPPSFLSN